MRRSLSQPAFVVRESVYYREKYSGDWPPGDLLGFATWVNGLVASIPRKYRAETRIEISSQTSYDSHEATIDVYYWRDENSEECARRKQKELDAAKASRAQELEVLAALKRKYEP